LPHVVDSLRDGRTGTTSPEFTYPTRLAAPLRRQYRPPKFRHQSRQGGEDAPEMMKRLQTAVLDMKKRIS